MKKLSRIESVLYVAIALAAALSILNVFILQGRVAQVSEARAQSEELAKPAEIEATKILLDGCGECFDIETALAEIKKQNVNLISEKTLYFESNEAKDIIRRHKIEKLPALIISGQVNKTGQLTAFFERIGAFSPAGEVVYDKVVPPYYDVSERRVVGKVSVINLIDSSCSECVRLSPVAEALKQSGVAITEEKSHEYSSPEGKKLIEKLNVSRVPALLISSEINFYDAARSQMQQLTLEKEGFYALHATSPPYRDLRQNKIVGLVKIILLNDSSCQECYDVNVNRQILRNFGVAIKEAATYDVSSEHGQALISKYGIEKAPILLMSPDVENYPSLVQVWESVGTVEDDGWYVMRQPEALGAYRSLKDGRVAAD